MAFSCQELPHNSRHDRPVGLPRKLCAGRFTGGHSRLHGSSSGPRATRAPGARERSQPFSKRLFPARYPLKTLFLAFLKVYRNKTKGSLYRILGCEGCGGGLALAQAQLFSGRRRPSPARVSPSQAASGGAAVVSAFLSNPLHQPFRTDAQGREATP